jgi:ribosomal-protein-serine acetyltransferase
MLRLDLGGGRRLRPVGLDDAEELDALVDANREHLSPWMPFAADQDLDGTREFLRESARAFEDGTGLQLAIAEGDGRICGMIGFAGIRRADRCGEIGYWLAADRQGAGVMTSAVRTVVSHGFGALGLHRIEILVAPENTRSRAIPERLGFVHEGTLRENERVGERFLDSAVYGMLAADWPPVT